MPPDHPILAQRKQRSKATWKYSNREVHLGLGDQGVCMDLSQDERSHTRTVQDVETSTPSCGIDL